MARVAESPIILEMRGITKEFPGVKALDAVSMQVRAGEVHAMVGENGAGKSTLMRVLGGELRPDAGEVEVGGEVVRLGGPTDAIRRGISIIHQEMALAPDLTVAENMMLGREPRRFGGIHTKAMNRAAKATLDRLGLDLDPASQLGQHPIAIQQLVAIARAVAWAKGVVFLDEPTAALGVVQTRNVLDTIRRVADRGVAVVFISHSMPHVMEVADRVQVLRMGKRVATLDAKNTTMEELVGAMTGATTGATR